MASNQNDKQLLDKEIKELQQQLDAIKAEVPKSNVLTKRMRSDFSGKDLELYDAEAARSEELTRQFNDVKAKLDKKMQQFKALTKTVQRTDPQIKEFNKNIQNNFLQAKKLEVALDTGIEMLDGIQRRKHEYKMKNASDKKKYGKDPIYSVTAITKMFTEYYNKENSGDTEATAYGTLLHKAIEELEKNKFGKPHEGMTIDAAKIKKFVEKLASSKKAEDQADAAGYLYKFTNKGKFNKNGQEQQATLNSLEKNINDYLRLKDKLGLGNKNATATEQALGARINIGGKQVNIAGTLDQIFGAMITDLKSSQSVGADYGLQINLLKLLAKINGINLDKNGKIIFLPRATQMTQKDAAAIQIDDLETQKLIDCINIAIRMKTAKTDDERDKLYKEGLQLLGSGGVHTVVGKGTFNINGKKVETETFNGLTLNQMAKHYAKNGGVEAMHGAISNISDSWVREKIQRKIGQKQVQTDDSDYKVDEVVQQMFLSLKDKYPSVYQENRDIWEKSVDMRDSEGNLQQSFESVQIGDRSFSGWMRLIARMSPDDRAAAFDKLVGIIEDNLIEPPGENWTTVNANKYRLTLKAINNINEQLTSKESWLASGLIPEEQQYWGELYDFLSSGGKLEDWEKQGKAWHNLKGVDIQGHSRESFISSRLNGISSLSDVEGSLKAASSRTSLHSLNSVFRDLGITDKSIMELMPIGASKALADQDTHFDPRRDQLLEDELLEDYVGKDNRKSEVQVAHKLAYLYYANQLYTRTMTDLFTKYSQDHNDNFTKNPVEFIRANLTSDQLKQFEASQSLQEEVDKALAQGDGDWGYVLWYLGGMAADPAWVDAIAGDDPNVRSVLRSLVDFYKGFEKNSAQYSETYSGYNGSLIDTIQEQIGEQSKLATMTGSGGALSDLILRGSTVTAMHKNLETQEEYLQQNVFDDRVSRVKADTKGHAAAQKMAKWREGQVRGLGYVLQSGESSRGNQHYVGVIFCDAVSNKRYLYESAGPIPIGEYVKCPTKQGPKKAVVANSWANTTEEWIRARTKYQGEIQKIIGIWTAEDEPKAENIEVGDPNELKIIDLDDDIEVRSPNAPTAEALLGDSASNTTSNESATVTPATPTEVAPATSKVVKNRKPRKKSSPKAVKVIQDTVKEVVEEKVDEALNTAATSTVDSSVNIKSIKDNTNTPKGIQNVENMKVTAEHITIKNVENNVNNYPKGTGAFAPAGASGGGGGRKGKAAEAAEVAPEEKLERLMRRIEIQYEGNLKDQLKILDNEHKIKELQKENTSESVALAKSLGESNSYLKEQIAGRQAKIDKFKQTEGVDTSELDRRYQIYLALQKNQYNYDKAHREGGGNNKGSKKPNYYSLDGRIVWWFERMINGGLLMSFFNIVKKGLTDAIKIAKELDKAMTNIRIVTGTTRAEAQQLTGEFINLSKQLGASAQDVLNAASEFYRQGYQTADVLELVESTTKLSKLGMIDMSKATQDLTSALKGFKMASNESIKVVDKLTAIDMQAAVTAGEIAEGLSQFANLANVNGVNLDQAAAYVATIAEVTQNSGSAVGSSLKMIMSRYGNVKAGAYNKLNVDAETMDNSQDLNDVEKVLKKLGISIRDANLHFKDFDTILDELAERWVDLDNVTKRAISTSFAGTRQQESFLTLMENYDKYKKNLEVSENSAGTANKKYKSYQESYEAAKESLDAAIKQLVNNAQINKILTDATKFLTGLVENFLPWVIKWLPMFLHTIEDIKTLLGRSLVQKTYEGVRNTYQEWRGKVQTQGTVPAGSLDGIARGGTAAAQTAGGGAEAAAASGGLPGGAVLAGISIAINSLTSALIAWKTAGTTHKYEDELVESSEAAQSTAGGVAALLAVIPFGLGSLVDNVFGISESLAAAIDADRDAAMRAAKDAANIIQKLDSINDNIEAIGSSDFGTEGFYNSLDELLSTLYEKDNKETRDVLDMYLGGPGKLYDTIQAIKKNDEKSLQAYKELQIAQLQAKKDQINNKYADQQYNISSTIGEKYSKFDNYSGRPEVGGTAGLIAGGAAVGAGAGFGLATLGSVGLALGSMGGVAGAAAIGTGLVVAAPIVAGLAVIAGLIAGITYAVETAEADRERHAIESEWNAKTTAEKMDEVEERIAKWQADTENDHAEDIKNAEELLGVLKEQNALISQMMDERNSISLQQGLIDAKYEDQYLQDMSIAQLKNLGIDQILQIIGESAEKHGFKGQTLFDNGKLTDAGYDFLVREVKNLGDDEISAVLSGQAYTLSEALKLREKLGNTKQVQRILESFSASLGTTVDQLEKVEDKYGSLTLAETYLSTTELATELSKYTGLLDSITTSSGNVSAWMNEIINQFPELIAYMSDLPTLFSKIGEKIRNLSNQYINAQYTAVSNDETTFSTIKGSFYKAIGNSDITEALDKANVSSIAQVTDWLKSEYLEGGKLSERGQAVLDALEETVNEFGLSITSSVLKGYYDQIINYKTQVLDTEINNLNEQKEALQDINKQREYENKLIEAKLKLENAVKDKKRVYRAGVGWTWESDQGAIADAQKNLNDLENQKTISELEMQIAELEDQKSQLGSIYEKQNFEYLEKLYAEFTEENGFAKTAEDLYQQMVKGISGIKVDLSKLIKDESETDQSAKITAIENAKAAWSAVTGATSQQDFNTALSNFHSAMQTAKAAGMTEQDTQSWGSSSGTAQGGHLGNKSAWEVANGKESDQRYTPKMNFTLNDPNNSNRYYTGYSNMELMTDAKISDDILDDIKDGGDAWMWLRDGDKGQNGFDPAKSTIYRATDDDKTLQDYVNRLYQQGIKEYVILGWDDRDYSVYVKDGQIYKTDGTESGDDNRLSNPKGKDWTNQFVESYGRYTGDLSFAGGPVLVNELGTEAIITPQGTLTSLPSQTGIVPADITKNLWALGDVAPNLMRMLELNLSNPKFTGVGTSTDESININTINMQVDADSSFDVNAFVESVKRKASLTRNLKR